MKKKPAKQKLQENQILNALDKITSRLEEATVDINDIKNDFKFVNLRLIKVEHNTEITKVDVEKMKKDLKVVKKNTEGLIETTGHILREAVTNDQHNALSQRVTALEQS